jgi:hypothetical protein
MISMHVRVSASLLERLDGLAAEREVDRSRLVRQLLEAGLRDRPTPVIEPPTEDELVAVLTERARNGNVSAARTLLARLEEDSPRERLIAEFERLARERRE